MNPDIQRLAAALMGQQQQPMQMPSGPRQMLQQAMQEQAPAAQQQPGMSQPDLLRMMSMFGSNAGAVTPTSPQAAMTAYGSMPASYTRPGM